MRNLKLEEWLKFNKDLICRQRKTLLCKILNSKQVKVVHKTPLITKILMELPHPKTKTQHLRRKKLLRKVTLLCPQIKIKRKRKMMVVFYTEGSSASQITLR